MVKTDGEIESSGFLDHTNNRNIREPVSAESINSPSMISFPRVLSSLFFPYFALRSHSGYYWWSTSCGMFSFSLWALLTTHRELWTVLEHLRTLFSQLWRICAITFVSITVMVYWHTQSPKTIVKTLSQYLGVANWCTGFLLIDMLLNGKNWDFSLFKTDLFCQRDGN